MKLLNKGVVFFTSLFLIFLFTKTQTDSFSEANIYTLKNQGYTKGSHIEALDQRYVYLSHGAQSFALASKDGQYVIKFFRNDRASHPLKTISFLLPSFAKIRLNQTLDKRESRRIKAFKSYLIAYEHLKESTGLLKVCLTPEETICQVLTYTDKIGVIHHFPLKKVPFLLQRKAAPFYPKLTEWIDAGKEELAKTSLSELINLLKSRCEKGIFDKDPDLQTNFGWIEYHPIQIDVGRFTLDETRKDPKIYREELFRITAPLRKWLESHSPSLSKHLEKELQTL